MESHLGIAFKLGIKLKAAELLQDKKEIVKVKVNGKEQDRHIDYERQKQA